MGYPVASDNQMKIFRLAVLGLLAAVVLVGTLVIFYRLLARGGDNEFALIVVLILAIPCSLAAGIGFYRGGRQYLSGNTGDPVDGLVTDIPAGSDRQWIGFLLPLLFQVFAFAFGMVFLTLAFVVSLSFGGFSAQIGRLIYPLVIGISVAFSAYACWWIWKRSKDQSG